MWFGLEVGVGIYAAICACIFAFQRHLMYHPMLMIGDAASYGLCSVKEIFIRSKDNTKLQVWMHNAKSGFPTILYFHGNAANLGDRAAKFSGFIDAGFGLVAVSYRGFGKSEGGPSEAGIYNDARTAIDYALNEIHLAQSWLIYYGESLGSGVAVQMASERAPGLLVLEAAYTSVETRSAELYPFVVGVRNLVLDKYDSLSKISKVQAPLLMLHGKKDMTIPVAHGRAILAAASEPKEMIEYADVYHADFSIPQIVEPVLRAAKNYGLIEN